MVRPVTDEKQLQALDRLPKSDLRPEFVKQVSTLVDVEGPHACCSLLPSLVFSAGCVEEQSVQKDSAQALIR